MTMIAVPIPPRIRRLCPRRYPTDMTHERTHLTIAEAARELGLTPDGVHSAIRRGQLDTELVNPRLRLVPRQAIATYRQEHLGHVGRPARKKRRKRAVPTSPEESAPAHVAAAHHIVDEGGAIHPPEE